MNGTNTLNTSKKKYSFFSSLNFSKIILIIFFALLVILPLLRMLFNIDAETFKDVITSKSFTRVLLNSVLATLTATAITIVLAYLLAICIERTDIKLKGLFNIVLVLPMLIPSISHGVGLVVMFGNNGLLTKLLNLDFTVYGFGGIVMGSVMYAFPVAFLMFADVLKYQDCTPYEAADVLGLNPWRKFTAITLPYLRKPLISVTLAVFTMIFTDYGVPLMVGGKFETVPVMLKNEVIGQLNFGKGSVYGLMLLVPAVIGFMFDLLNKDKGNSAYNTRSNSKKSKAWQKVLAYIFCIAVSVFTLLPIIVFIILALSKTYPVDLTPTLEHIIKAFDVKKAGEYLLNSLTISLFVALIGVVVSFVTAYMTARAKSKMSKFLHLFAITSAAIPGLVLGLSYILVFKGTFFYGTLAILIMVNIIHFISSPYLMMYNSFSKLNENLEDVGQTLGISRMRIIMNVILPQSLSTVFEMFSYFFVNSMMTISAVAFLSKVSNQPLSLLITQSEGQMQLEVMAVVSLVILAVNLIIKGGINIINKQITKRSRRTSGNELPDA